MISSIVMLQRLSFACGYLGGQYVQCRIAQPCRPQVILVQGELQSGFAQHIQQRFHQPLTLLS